MEKLAIGPEMRALCKKLGVDYDSTLEITFRPDRVQVVVANRNESGSMYVDLDTGEVSKATIEFQVAT